MKDMKTKSLLLLLTLAFAALYGCSPAPKTNKCIAPLPAGTSVDNLTDCTIPVAFTTDEFDWMGGNLTLTVYNEDLYDAVEVSLMQVGDTLIYRQEPIVITSLKEDDRGILEVNGGLEEGGCWLVGYEGGTYRSMEWDDHSAYTELGKAQVALAEDFRIIDCGLNPEDPSDTISTGQKLYLENLPDGRKDFFSLNTRVTIENGMITEINRKWIP